MSTSTGTPPPEQAAQHALQLATGYIISAALQVAVTLGIPDRLAAGAATTADLASATGTNEDALHRVLRALAMVGVFTEEAPRRFAQTAASDALRSTPGSMRDMVRWMTDPFHFRLYAETLHSVQTGTPAVEKVTGQKAFDFLAGNHELSELFNDAMTSMSASVVPAVVQAYDFAGIDVLVDVAGGHGEVLTSVLQAHPAMRGVLFDLDHVIEGAGARLREKGLADRCRTASGDFFEAVPEGGDAYLMKHIVHDWDDEAAVTILKHIHRALAGKADGRLILLEAVIQPGNQPDFAKLLDLEMLIAPGGRERTQEEFEALFARAGFRLARIVPTASSVSVIEARLG